MKCKYCSEEMLLETPPIDKSHPMAWLDVYEVWKCQKCFNVTIDWEKHKEQDKRTVV